MVCRVSPASQQHRLDVAVRVGGVLVGVGLVAATVIIGLYLANQPMPGTWAYGIAMLAPLGFAVILVSLLGAALQRRRGSLDDS